MVSPEMMAAVTKVIMMEVVRGVSFKRLRPPNLQMDLMWYVGKRKSSFWSLCYILCTPIRSLHLYTYQCNMYISNRTW